MSWWIGYLSGKSWLVNFYSLLPVNTLMTSGCKSARGAPCAFVNFAYAEFHSCAVLLPSSPPHCAGWVYLLHSHHSKKDPWNTVHGLFNTSFNFITSPTNRTQLSPPHCAEWVSCCCLYFWIPRFRGEWRKKGRITIATYLQPSLTHPALKDVFFLPWNSVSFRG